MWRFAKNQAKKPEMIGATFSQVQAERFGVDWQQNYLALLDDLHFKNLRLIAYWNRVELKKDQYDFSELDWMMDEATKRNVKITLVIGQKVPRWPECYYPDWLDKNNANETSYRADRYISQVVKRYKNHPALQGWQLENEFLLRSYGRCPSNNLTRDQLKKELSTIKGADLSHPIMLSQSDEFGWPILGPFADKFGFSLYKRVWMESLKGYFKYPQPGLLNWFKASIINFYSNQEIVAHELQAESWAKTGNEFISPEEMSKTMNPTYFDENIRYVRDSRIKEYYLWGSEWWYYMKTKKNSPAMWEKVKELLQKTNP
jgi:hypothetical protein